MSAPFDIAIVGAGLSTLSALREAASKLRQRVIVLDYRDKPGGFLLPSLPTPEFSEECELIKAFQMPPTVTAHFQTTAVGLIPAFEQGQPHSLVVRQHRGTTQIQARSIVIASGALERPREQACIPGTRPAGVMTPILVHQLLEQGYLPGKRAIVYGGSRYARATALRLVKVGVDVVSLLPSINAAANGAGTVDLLEVQGFPRLEGVKLCQNGDEITMPADTLVYAVGAMANTHWLKGSDIELNEDGSIRVDAHYRTNIPGIYALGNVVAPSLDHTDSIKMGKGMAALLQGEQI